jgi:aminoglycoside 3-N-acetyltransferase
MSPSYADILSTLRKMELSDCIVILHSSLKSFGLVEGGADAAIDSFRDAGCTLIVPTFTYECQLPPPEGRTILRNGMDSSYSVDRDKAQGYDPNENKISRDMGAIPARILHRPERIRGGHPLNSFAGLGPRASELMACQGPLNVYGPMKQILLDPKAVIVLAGVGLTKATPVHLAEERSGRRLFRRWAKMADGMEIEVEEGGCSEGFENLAPYVKAVERQAKVGDSLWRIFPLRGFIDAIVPVLRENPFLTHCDDENCARCNDAARGGPLL